MNLKIICGRIFFVSLFLIAACSQGPGGHSYTLNPQALVRNGCLNMGVLLTKMQDFGANTQARLYTKDMSYQGAGNERPIFPLVAFTA